MALKANNNVDIPTIRVLSLCSGTGGLDLAVRLTLSNARTVCYVENGIEAVAILASRFKDGTMDEAPIWSDLRTFNGEQWRDAVDFVIAGFPCPPVNTAGKRKGIHDERWLWPEVARVVCDVRPRWIFLENVRGLLSANEGVATAEILRDLARMGYDAEWCLLRASDVGAPHERARWFCLTWMDNSKYGRCKLCNETKAKQKSNGTDNGLFIKRSNELANTKCDGWRQGTEDIFWRKSISSFLGKKVANIRYLQGTKLANAYRNRQHGKGICLQQGKPFRQNSNSCGTISIFPPGPTDFDNWQSILKNYPDLAPAIERQIRNLAHGSPRGMDLSRADQLRCLGNMVVPLQGAVALAILIERMNRHHGI